MRATLRWIRIAAFLLIAAGALLYIYSPRSKALIILSLVTGFLIIITAAIFSYRQAGDTVSSITARKRTGTYLSAAIVLTVLILLQAVVIRNNVRIDTTHNSRFSLSRKTLDVIGGLESGIRIIAFYKETDREKSSVEDLLENYHAASGKIEYEFVNPDRSPTVARRYNVQQFGVTVVESASGWEKITGVTESKLTNSIYRSISRKRLKIYFLTGHGERSISDGKNVGYANLAELLRGENFSVEELSLGAGSGIPGDCNVLVIAGPERDILPFEQETVSDYLEDKGRALFLIDPLTECGNITATLSPYGIIPENSIIVDRSGMLTSGNYLTPVVNRYGNHPITRGFTYFSFFPQARSVAQLDSAEGVNVTPLCFTNQNAYAESDLDLVMEGKTKFDRESDSPGPVLLAAVSSVSEPGSSTAPETRVALFGDSDFASNKILDLYGNRDLIMNTINWLTKRENLITIRPRDNLVQPVLLTMRQGRLVYWLSIAVLPALVIMAGVWVLARKKRLSGND
ncbi:MAG: GldG family protein [Candidatus Krumholzibacteriota bacterium]